MVYKKVYKKYYKMGDLTKANKNYLINQNKKYYRVSNILQHSHRTLLNS